MSTTDDKRMSVAVMVQLADQIGLGKSPSRLLEAESLMMGVRALPDDLTCDEFLAVAAGLRARGWR